MNPHIELRADPPNPAEPAAVFPIPAPYHLARTLQSGQCFRWSLTANGAKGIVEATVVQVNQNAGGLTITWEGPRRSPQRLIRYLGADQPLAGIETALARDPVLRRLLAHTSGIAIMRQDPWECLVSYVISAFNNIPKIQLSIRHLARCFGEPIPRSGGPRGVGGDQGGAAGGSVDTEWAFPPPERLAGASLQALRGCVLGYRARYVRDLARLVADRTIDLHAIAGLPVADARAALLELPGVGEKVADCVLLFAFGHDEAFPVDVWVQRAVERWYFRERSTTPRAIRTWARDRFGPLAGYAQQHLFAGARLPRVIWGRSREGWRSSETGR